MEVINLGPHSQGAQQEQGHDKVRNPTAYRIARVFTNKGLPGIFVLFIVIYFIVGVSFYSSVISTYLGDE